MKLQQLVLMLLIGMISFTGFSHTTTDLSQDSNHEIVLSFDSIEFHGVADLNVLNLNLEKEYVLIASKDFTFSSDSLTESYFIEDEPEVTKKIVRETLDEINKSVQKRKQIHLTTHIKPFRLARDGFRC